MVCVRKEEARARHPVLHVGLSCLSGQALQRLLVHLLGDFCMGCCSLHVCIGANALFVFWSFFQQQQHLWQ